MLQSTCCNVELLVYNYNIHDMRIFVFEVKKNHSSGYGRYDKESGKTILTILSSIYANVYKVRKVIK